MDLTLHVGMYKTASTTLQQEVFPRLADVDTVGRKHPGETEGSPLSTAMRRIWNDVYWAGELRQRLEERAGARPLLVSEELWTSPVLHRTWERLDRTAERLAREAPEATVLIVVRRPADLLVSSYAQYLRAGGTMTWRTFVASCDLRMFDVDAVARLYTERFATVRVLAFEDLADPATFTADLVEAVGSNADPGEVAEWLRSTHNAALSPLLSFVQLAANRTIRASHWNPTPPLPLLQPLYYRLISPGADWAQQRLNARSWKPNRRIVAARRRLAERETESFRYPVTTL